MMFYKNTKVAARSPGENIVAGAIFFRTLQVHSTSMDLIKGFTFKKKRNRWYPAETITDADYADNLAHLTSTPTEEYIYIYMHTYIYIYIVIVTDRRIYIYLHAYIYIYIYCHCHRQTASLYHNSLLWLDPWDTSTQTRLT